MQKIVKLKGQIAFSGNVSGKARVLRKDEIPHHFEEGNILIAECTHPEHLPAILKSKAMLMETGGMLCHSAIVAREFKIPCVVGIKNLLKTVSNNDTITLKNGEIIVHKK